MGVLCPQEQSELFLSFSSRWFCSHHARALHLDLNKWNVRKSWIFVQIGPDQYYIKSLLLSLLQCLVGACFQEWVVGGGCQEQGKVLEGSLTGPPEKWEPPWGTVLTTAQREPPPSCSVCTALATREDAAASLAFSSSSFSINDFSFGKKTLALIRPVQCSGVWMSGCLELFLDGYLLGIQGLDSTFKDAWGLQCWGVQWGATQMHFRLGFGPLRKSPLILPTLPPSKGLARGSHPVVVRCGWEEMCNFLSPPFLPIQRPWHKLPSIVMGSKIFLVHLHVKLRSHQWGTKLNSCLCLKVDWKSSGQCPKSSYFCHLRLRFVSWDKVTLGKHWTKIRITPEMNEWICFSCCKKTRKRKKASSLNLRVWINHYTA